MNASEASTDGRNGVKRSAPVTCLTDAERDAFRAKIYALDSDAGLAAALADNKIIADKCAEKTGPLDEKACRLVKLAVAIGGRSEGAVHSAARKALAAGVTAAEIEQVIALAASTIGFPRAVAAYTWVRDLLGSPASPGPSPAG